jgi:hypothetical protein
VGWLQGVPARGDGRSIHMISPVIEIRFSAL